MSNWNGVRWTFIFIGMCTILAVYYIYLHDQKVRMENFTAANNVTTGATGTTGAAAGTTGAAAGTTAPAGTTGTAATQEEVKLPMDDLKLYTNVFLNESGKTPLYLPGASKLVDAMNPLNIFTIIASGNIPDVITSASGLPIVDTQLKGPPSNMLGTQLKKFTLLLYIKLKDIKDDTEVALVQIFTESPDFGNRVTCIIDKKADLLGDIILEIHLPALQTYVSWTNGIGYYMIDLIELQFGGETIDRVTGDFLNSWSSIWFSRDISFSVRCVCSCVLAT